MEPSTEPRPLKRKQPATPETSPLDKFTCPICLELLCKPVESSCCGNIFCEDCVKKVKIESGCPVCRHKVARKAGSPVPANWSRSKWIERQLDELAPRCKACKKHVPPEETQSHQAVCPARNCECFKCSGLGRVKVQNGSTKECNGCDGRGHLEGTSWTRCFKCGGRGRYDQPGAEEHQVCEPCRGKGALSGREWTRCFKCAGSGMRGILKNGAVATVGCPACLMSSGALEGSDWQQCFKCGGRGVFMTLGGERRACNGCSGRGGVRGACWAECAKCAGRGSYRTTSGVRGPDYFCDECGTRGVVLVAGAAGGGPPPGAAAGAEQSTEHRRVERPVHHGYSRVLRPTGGTPPVAAPGRGGAAGGGGGGGGVRLGPPPPGMVRLSGVGSLVMRMMRQA